MYELVDTPPRNAKIVVICLADEFPKLPLFFDSTLLVIDKEAKNFTEWRWCLDNHIEPPDQTAYQRLSSKELSRQSITETLLDTDMLIALTSYKHPHRKQIITLLQGAITNHKPSLLISVSWPFENQQQCKGFDTSLPADSLEQATLFTRTIIELVSNNMMIGIDFADVRTVLTHESPLLAKGSSGIGKGDNRAVSATKMALSSITTIKDTDNILAAIYAGSDLKLSELTSVMDLLEEYGTSNLAYNGIYLVGCIFDPAMELSKELKVALMVCTPTNTVLLSINNKN